MSPTREAESLSKQTHENTRRIWRHVHRRTNVFRLAVFSKLTWLDPPSPFYVFTQAREQKLTSESRPFEEFYLPPHPAGARDLAALLGTKYPRQDCLTARPGCWPNESRPVLDIPPINLAFSSSLLVPSVYELNVHV